MKPSKGGMQSAGLNCALYCPKCGKPAARKEMMDGAWAYMHFTKKGLFGIRKCMPKEKAMVILMNKTKIEWCTHTWNPVTGCLHGCEYCYARRIAQRFGKPHDPIDYCDVYNGKPIYELLEKADSPYPFVFSPTFHHYRLDEPQHTKKPRNIFVCSMADLFGDWVPDEWIDRVFRACDAAPWHNYLFLTKNPERYVELLRIGKLPRQHWYGTTATEPTDDYFAGAGYKTFLSMEPLHAHFCSFLRLNLHVPNWIIVGAEKGNRNGKITPEREWVDDICSGANSYFIPVFMKDSLLPIMSEQNMRREYPAGLGEIIGAKISERR